MCSSDLLEVFPHGAVFANTANGQGYDLVLYGPRDEMKINVDEVQKRLDDPANARIAQSLREINIFSAVDLFGTYAGNPTDMANWLRDAQINTDRNLRLQFLAGQSLNVYQSDPIYKKMIVDTNWPENLFEGSPETLAAVRQRIDQNLAISRPPSF